MAFTSEVAVPRHRCENAVSFQAMSYCFKAYAICLPKFKSSVRIPAIRMPDI
jgi:hypothetical protein